MTIRSITLQAALGAAALVPLVPLITLIPLVLPAPAFAAVSPAEAQRLGAELTPVGAEKAANQDGSIPAWTGGFTGPYVGYTGGRRPDPFADDKPLFTITGQNMAQYQDKLAEGTRALLAKYPDYKVNVYKTQRTARTSASFAERTAQAATKTKLVGEGTARKLADYVGGIPFPIPQTGEEAMWNHLLRFRGNSELQLDARVYVMTAEGKRVLILDNKALLRTPPSYAGFKADAWDGYYQQIRLNFNGPAIRVGEQVITSENIDPAKSEAYTYLPGQRRVRRLPNACCDAASVASAGIANVDDTSVWFGRLDRFNWKLVGKKEMFIPYNTNRFNVPTKDDEVLAERYLNPQHVRWELHRVWVVEANVVPGMRHTTPKSLYYLDEDTWTAVVADRWDAKGQLWKHSFSLPIVVPDQEMNAAFTFGFYDLLAGTFVISNLLNEKASQVSKATNVTNATYEPDSMASSGVR